MEKVNGCTFSANKKQVLFFDKCLMGRKDGFVKLSHGFLFIVLFGRRIGAGGLLTQSRLTTKLYESLFLKFSSRARSLPH